MKFDFKNFFNVWSSLTNSTDNKIIYIRLRYRVYSMSFLSVFRTELDSERGNRSATIDDLHNRLKVNVDTVQQLHTQVSDVSIVYFFTH